MKLLDVIILGIGIVATILWTVYSNKDGLKINNAIIAAHSITISSTIDGEIENDPPKVGALVKSNDLLVHIESIRIDRHHLVDLESQIGFLEQETENLSVKKNKLLKLLKQHEQRAKTYAVWMLQDVKLKNTEVVEQLEVAKQQLALKTEEVTRLTQLYEQQNLSSVTLAIAITETEILQNQVDMKQTQLERSNLLIQSLNSEGVFFEDGDTSYWEKMTDTLRERHFETHNQTLTLKAQLVRAKRQAEMESERISSSLAEDLHSPFNGMVSASFVTRGTRVVSGTELMEILDCANPLVIVPLPEHRIAEFSAGMKVTIYPIGAQQEIPGTIKYISSGPLIGHDKSLQIQQDLILSGVHAVVIPDTPEMIDVADHSCESRHLAVVMIHM